MKRLLILSIIMILLSSMCVYANTDNMLKISNKEYKDRDVVKENIQLKFLTEENTVSAIHCFDVSDNGMIALGLEDEYINIYNKYGEYVYSYSFDLYGTYYIRWNSDNLIIYLVRENLAVEIANGSSDILSIKEIIDEWSFASATYKYLSNTTKKFNENEYQISKNMGLFNLISGNYSKLEVIKSNGTKDVIFDVSNMYTVRLALEFTFVMILLMIVFVGLIKTIRHASKSQEGTGYATY